MVEGVKWNELSSSVASLGLELDSGVRLSVLVLSVFSSKPSCMQNETNGSQVMIPQDGDSHTYYA